MQDLVAVGLGAFLVFFNESLTNTLFTPYLKTLGYPVSLIGTTVALLSLAAFASRLPAGLIYRRRRGYALNTAGTAVLAAILATYAFVAAPPAMAAVRLLHGLAWGLVSTVNTAMFWDAVPQGMPRSRVVAFYSICVSGGLTSGNLFAGLVADHWGFAGTFLAGSAVTVVGAIPIVALRRRWAQVQPVGAADAADPPQVRGPRLPLRLQLGQLRDSRILVPIVSIFIVRWMLYTFNSFLPLYVLQVGMTLTVVGLVRATQSGTGFLSRLLAGEVLRKVPPRLALIVSLVLSAVAMAALPVVRTALPLALLAGFLGVSRSFTELSVRTEMLYGVEAHRRARGLAAGFFHSAGDAGAMLGPFVGGLVAEAYGLEFMFHVVPAAALAAGLMLVLVADRYGRAGAQTAAQPAAQEFRVDRS